VGRSCGRILAYKGICRIFLAYTLVIRQKLFGSCAVSETEEIMELLEAATIVEAIADSLKSDPNQFYISISAIGQQITSHGGTGLVITATGGGPGSKTVGQVVSMDGTNFEIARGKADQAMAEQINALVNSLETVAKELSSSEPDKSKIKQIFDTLTGTWVPGIIIGVLSNVLSASIGI
jgi:hypothetical protein